MSLQQQESKIVDTKNHALGGGGGGGLPVIRQNNVGASKSISGCDVTTLRSPRGDRVRAIAFCIDRSSKEICYGLATWRRDEWEENWNPRTRPIANTALARLAKYGACCPLPEGFDKSVQERVEREALVEADLRKQLPGFKRDIEAGLRWGANYDTDTEAFYRYLKRIDAAAGGRLPADGSWLDKVPDGMKQAALERCMRTVRRRLVRRLVMRDFYGKVAQAKAVKGDVPPPTFHAA